MDHINSQFEFLDFEPDSGLRGLTSQVLAEIVGHAPSDASSVARVARTRDGYEASLKLSSLAGTFAAVEAAKDAAEAIERVSDRIMDQISGWRRARIRRESFCPLIA